MSGSFYVLATYLILGLIIRLFAKHLAKSDLIEALQRIEDSNRWRTISLCPNGCLAVWGEEPERPSPYVVVCPRCLACPPEMHQHGNSHEVRCVSCGFVDNVGRFISNVPNGTLGIWAERIA